MCGVRVAVEGNLLGIPNLVAMFQIKKKLIFLKKVGGTTQPLKNVILVVKGVIPKYIVVEQITGEVPLVKI